MRVGLFGGTLNPIHFGHLRSAEEIREHLSLDAVWFIPAGMPPHKHTGALAPWQDRMEMVRLAVSGNSFFRAVDTEARRAGYSYTVDTLRMLASGPCLGKELFFIMGSDAFLDVMKWKEYHALVEYASLVIMGRHGVDWNEVRSVLESAFVYYRPDSDAMKWSVKGRNEIIFVDVTGLEISSTDIRKRVADRRTVRYLVPEKVENYMKQKNLYIRDVANPAAFDTGTVEPEHIARKIAQEINDNKGEEITVLDVRGISAFADFFIVAHGRSSRHVQGIMSKIRKNLSKNKIKCKSIEGDDDGKWILMDYEDCIVHLFYEPVRRFYDLEGLWHDAPRLEWSDDDFGE